MKSARAALPWLLPAALLVAFALDLKWSANILRSQRLIRAVEGRTLAMIQSGKLQRPLIVSHIAALQDAKRYDPAEVASRMALGSEHFLLSDFVAARAAYEDALALEPRPEILLNLAKSYYAAGDPEPSKPYFARAAKLDPALAREVPKEVRLENRGLPAAGRPNAGQPGGAKPKPGTPAKPKSPD